MIAGTGFMDSYTICWDIATDCLDRKPFDVRIYIVVRVRRYI